MFSTDDHFEISVSTSLFLQNLPLSVERASLCSLQMIALKLVCQLRYCYKICPCQLRELHFAIDDRFEIIVSISLVLQYLPLLVESFALFSIDNHFEISVSIARMLPNLTLLVERVKHYNAKKRTRKSIIIRNIPRSTDSWPKNS